MNNILSPMSQGHKVSWYHADISDNLTLCVGSIGNSCFVFEVEKDKIHYCGLYPNHFLNFYHSDNSYKFRIWYKLKGSGLTMCPEVITKGVRSTIKPLVNSNECSTPYNKALVESLNKLGDSIYPLGKRCYMSEYSKIVIDRNTTKPVEDHSGAKTLYEQFLYRDRLQGRLFSHNLYYNSWKMDQFFWYYNQKGSTLLANSERNETATKRKFVFKPSRILYSDARMDYKNGNKTFLLIYTHGKQLYYAVDTMTDEKRKLVRCFESQFGPSRKVSMYDERTLLVRYFGTI